MFDIITHQCPNFDGGLMPSKTWMSYFVLQLFVDAIHTMFQLIV